MARQPADRLGPRAERTIHLILDAARVVFERLGYAGATVDEIAREASISRASVYTYFASKREIFFALGALASNPTRQELLTEALTKPIDFDQCLALVNGWFAVYEETAGITMIWREAARDDKEMLEIGRKSHLRVCRRFGTALQKRSIGPLGDPTASGLAILAQWEGAWRYCTVYQDKMLIENVKTALAQQLFATLTIVGSTAVLD
jgi:AcrR family transcriptional regulator